MFKKYPKILRLGTEETDGILDGLTYIQEKIDGANASIWTEDGKVCVASRNNKLTSNIDRWEEDKNNNFKGLLEYVKTHKEIRRYLTKNPFHRLYGEWLIKHTINYDETKMKEFYMFDIERDGLTSQEWMSIVDVTETGREYNICTPEFLGAFTDIKQEELMKFVGKSAIGELGEGIVIKNPAFINKFDNHQYAKIVTDNFKEQNAIIFGGNNKYSKTYLEMYFVNKFISLARVKKVVQKIETTEDRRIKIQDTPRVMSTVYHDMLSEEFWTIAKKKGRIDYKEFGRLAHRKAKQIFHDILNNSINIADEN